jgi:predicted secreted protein
MATPIKGEVGILYVADGASYKPVACLTSNSLSTAVSVIESNTKCNPGITKKQAGMFSYTLEAEGEYIDTTSVGGDDTKASHDFLFGLQLAKELITWKLVTGVSGATYYGSALISDLSLDLGSGDDLATFSLTLDGDGEISTIDPLD